VGGSESPGTSSRPAAPAVVAVDGGNSKTDAVVCDTTGSVLGSARGGPGCHQMVGLDAAVATIEATVDAAVAEAALPPLSEAPVPVAVYCLAGLDLPIDHQRLRAALGAPGRSDRVVLHNDTMAVMRAGASTGFGIGVVCGAGLNCAGLGPDGATVRFPALGEPSGDFAQGGSWLGTRGLGLALRAGDGRGRPTVLRDTVAGHFGCSSPEEVLERFYEGQLGYERLSELAEVVLEAAAGGDRAAREAVDVLADEVVAMTGAAATRLRLTDAPVEVVLGGGLFQTSDQGFHRRVRDGVAAVAPHVRFKTLSGPPVLGAALLGLDSLGVEPAAERRLRAALGPAEPTG
jgi:N-acetylglucosamine kinase-like BadF-type ATPase